MTLFPKSFSNRIIGVTSPTSSQHPWYLSNKTHSKASQSHTHISYA
jgi:hypothetical protein